jgi:hypothetical protein
MHLKIYQVAASIGFLWFLTSWFEAAIFIFVCMLKDKPQSSIKYGQKCLYWYSTFMVLSSTIFLAGFIK